MQRSHNENRCVWGPPSAVSSHRTASEPPTPPSSPVSRMCPNRIRARFFWKLPVRLGNRWSLSTRRAIARSPRSPTRCRPFSRRCRPPCDARRPGSRSRPTPPEQCLARGADFSQLAAGNVRQHDSVHGLHDIPQPVGARRQGDLRLEASQRPRRPLETSGRRHGQGVGLARLHLEQAASVSAPDEFRARQGHAVQTGDRQDSAPDRPSFRRQPDAVDGIEYLRPRRVVDQTRPVVVHVGHDQVRRVYPRHAPPGLPDAAFVRLRDSGALAFGEVSPGRVRRFAMRRQQQTARRPRRVVSTSLR